MRLLQIYQWVCQWKNFENRLTFGEVMGKSLVSCFFLRHSVLHVEGSESPPITWFLEPTWVHTQNGTSIGLVILAQLMVVTNRHTHRPRNTGNNRPHLFSMRVMQPNNSELCWWRFSSLPPVIYQFKRLEILMANDNQIGDVDAESLCQMPMIATLALQNNNISAVPPQLGNCTQLRFQLVLYTKTWKKTGNERLFSVFN